jgi:type I restriction enzyme S subunit
VIDGWITDEIDNLCNVEYGTRVVQKIDGGTIYPVYGGGGATFAMDIYNREDRLTIARFAMSAKCTRFVKGKFFLNDSGLTLSPKDKSKIEQEFLNYQCLAMNDVFYSLAKGSAQKNLDVPAFRKLKLNIPKDINTQRKIVLKLNQIFAEIDKATAAAEANAKNADLLVKGTITALIKKFGEDSFVKFGDICGFVRGPFGGSLKKSIFVEKGYSVYEQQHPINNQFDSFRYFITDEKFNEMKRFEVFPHDLLMSCSGVTLGKIAIVPKDAPKGIINQALLKITPKDIVRKDYLKVVMESDYFQSILWDVSGGAAQPNVPSVKVIKDFLIPLPSIKEQDEFIDVVSSVNSSNLVGIYKEKKKSLISFKQSILRKAFNGELVKE